jgi:hypothetical protein
MRLSLAIRPRRLLPLITPDVIHRFRFLQPELFGIFPNTSGISIIDLESAELLLTAKGNM